eukprot:1750336-Pleurochrysis_carterae.AAC.1
MSTQLASFYGTRQAIEHALRSSLKANRGSALRLVGAMAVRAPAAAHGFISVLTTAYSVETGALRHYALALALDGVFAVSRLPETATDDAAQQLAAALQWLPQVLASTSVEEQTLAVLGLGKIVLMRHERTLLTARHDAEALIADIALRYTSACTFVSSDRQRKQWPLHASLLAFFEALADQRSNDVSNTIAWLVLDAVDETSLGVDMGAERLRCLRFLASFLKERALHATLQLVRSNLSEMFEHTDCPTPTDADIRQWFGRQVPEACRVGDIAF